MVVDKVLIYNRDNQEVLDDHLGFHRREDPMVLQLGGSDPELLAEATKVVHQYGYDQVNLNAGCPSCRVAGLGDFGAALMRKPEVIVSCLEAMSQAAPIKVSVKTRLGVDDLDSKEYFTSLVDTVRSARLSNVADFSLVVHARKAWLKGLSPAQNRSIPPLQYDRAFEVCGEQQGLKWYLNGGINTFESALELLHQGPSNLEGVMMGRAAMNTPCIFAHADTLLYGEDADLPTAVSRGCLLEAYCDYLHDKYDEAASDKKVSPGVTFKAVKPVLGVFHGTKNSRKWRAQLDQLVRTQRGERNPAETIREAMKEIDSDLLYDKL